MMLWLLGCALSAPETALLALDAEVPLERALKACGRLPDEAEGGDCMVSALEARGALSEPACAQVFGGARDECIFLTAEQLREEGQVAEALRLCERTLYGRECTFHLIRDEARRRVEEPIDQAEAGLAQFERAERAPDAARLYWQEWVDRRISQDLQSDLAWCARVSSARACEEGFNTAWRLRLRGVPADQRCEGEVPVALDDGRPAILGMPVLPCPERPPEGAP